MYETEKRIESTGLALLEADDFDSEAAQHWLDDIINSGDAYIDWAPGYCEPGYTVIEQGVLFADWNSVSRPNVETGKYEKIHDAMGVICRVVEELGYSIEWSDEWSTCGDCNNAFRTSPDHYGWKPHYAIIQGEYVCADCIQEDPDDYLQSLEGDPTKGVTFDLDLSEHGYINLIDAASDRGVEQDTFESGLYGGQDASPDKIAEALQNAGIQSFVFRLDSTSQFDLRFSVWIGLQDMCEVDQDGVLDSAVQAVFGNDAYHADVDPATAMKQGLQAASAAMSRLPDGQGIKHATIHDDGTATVKIVSPQAFIEGKM